MMSSMRANRNIPCLAALLLPLFLLLSCNKEPEGTVVQPEEPITGTVHYRVTVTEGTDTRAGLNDSHQYIFEDGDRLYVTNSAGSLYGFLSLASAPKQTTATFEGDLACVNSFTPTDATPVSVTLVSATDAIHRCANGKLTGTAYPTNLYAANFAEAVQKFSHFTATGLYGDQNFTLSQGSSFLIFNIVLEGTTATEVTAEIKNGTETLRSGTVAANVVDLALQANFVAAFRGGTSLTGAQLTIDSGEAYTITNTTLEANKYYTVSRSPEVEFFTIQATQNGTVIKFDSSYIPSHKIQFSTDGGNNWTALTSDNNGISLANRGDCLQVRAQGQKFQKVLFTSSDNKLCYIYGDIMSLICDTEYQKISSLPNNNYNGAFKGTFKNTTHIDIPAGRPLRLTATELMNNCYREMFRGCTSLTHAPEFSNAATIPADACYDMFNGCTALLAAPELPATTVGASGCRGMFYGCTSLASAPSSLPTNLGNTCFREMFRGCTSLSTAPQLGATNVPAESYWSMFYGCTALLAAPELPATSIGQSCYEEMFCGCTSLTSAPSSLPATALFKSCYKNMFKNCEALQNVPELPATTAAEQCYYGMFDSCISINLPSNRSMPLTSIENSSCYRMFYGCLSLVHALEMSSSITSVGEAGCREMYTGCAELTTTPTALWAKNVGQNGYFSMFKNCPKITAAPFIAATSVGNSAMREMFNGCIRLVTPPSSLSMTQLPQEACYQMFSGCTNLTSAPSFRVTYISGTTACYQMFFNCSSLTSAAGITLSASSLTTNCYRQMFSGCTSLTSAPTITVGTTDTPGTTAESCCFQMFLNCPRLASAEGIKLYATGLSKECYKEMFSGCTSLTSAPTVTVGTTAESCCYRMFYNCSSLASSATITLSAPSLTQSCYQEMFRGCSSITSAPALPATTLAQICYDSMFFGCTNLEGPIYLPAEMLVNRCYQSMFQGASKLNTVICMATNHLATDTNYTLNWLQNVSSSGIFYYASGQSDNWARNNASHIPKGWTALEYGSSPQFPDDNPFDNEVEL